MTGPVLTDRQLNRALLARQGLLRRKRISVRAAIDAAGGLQSQEPKDPHVALWSRISHFDPRQLREAAQRRSGAKSCAAVTCVAPSTPPAPMTTRCSGRCCSR